MALAIDAILPTSFEVSHDNKEAELVGYEVSPMRSGDNMNYSPFNYYFQGSDNKMTQCSFVPQIAIFEKPVDSVNHLKPLYVTGYINSSLVNKMLVDRGASMNLMPYSLYKKLGGSDEALIRTKRKIKVIGGGKPIPAKGLTLMKLTIGSKTLATIFSIAEVQ